MISKVYPEISDVAAKVITLKFESGETVGQALVKIAGKLKLRLSKEEILSRYSLIFRGVPSAKYLLLDVPIEEYLNDEYFKSDQIHLALVRRSYKIVIIGLNMENEYIHVDFCKERELEGLLGQMARTNGEKVKDLYLVSASNPDKELNPQKTLMDQNLVHEDVLLLKARKKRRKTMGSKRIKKMRRASPVNPRHNSFSSIPGISKGGTKTIQLYLTPVVFYTMRWIEFNAIETPCIFQLPGKISDVEQLKKAFDLGYVPDLDTASDPFVVCDLLKVGLKSQIPCLDFSFWERFTHNTLESPLSLIKLLADLPTGNIHLLKHVCTFLHRIVEHSSGNRMNSTSLGNIFAPVLSPCSSENAVIPDAVTLTKTLIDNPEWIPKKQHPPLVKSFAVTFNSSELVSLQTIKPQLLLTEEIQWEHSGAILVGYNKKNFKGTLFASNYRVLFQFTTATDGTPFFELPLASILAIDREKDSAELFISGKNFVVFHLRFPTADDCQRVYDYMGQFCPPQPLNQLFTFSYALFYEEEGNTPMKSVLGARHTFLNPEAEYLRQGAPIPQEWRNYACKQATTYPRQILIPSALKEEQKEIFPKDYHNYRFPTLVYHHSSTSSCVLISSGYKKQTILSPMVSAPNLSRNAANTRVNSSRASGVKFVDDKIDQDDESELLKCIKEIQPSENIEIMKCLRPTDLSRITSLPKNRQMLPFTDVVEIYTKLRRCILDQDMEQLKQATTEWTTSLSEVILTSVTTAVGIVHGKSYIFEDDEWNHLGIIGRVMIIVDPFYRTIRGFQRLVEHVWIRFGFPFADACGIDTGAPHALEIGVFIHFVDSIWQIFHQFPSCFEFNEGFLIALLNAVFSGCYGTFLSNNEKQAHSKLPITVSVWQFLSETNSQFLNPLYTSKDRIPLIPDTSSKKIVFWGGFFFQWISQQGIARYILNHNDGNIEKGFDISHLSISYLPDTIVGMYNHLSCEEANLSHNNFPTFPTGLLLACHLKHINLSYNKITSIPQDIIASLQNLSELESLDFRGNPLGSIDSSICVLTSLRTLRISGNGEKQELKGPLSLCSLTQLYLDHFGLTEVPESLMDMKALSTLSLAENKLSHVSLSIPTLRTLNLSHNLLTADAVTITARKLHHLDLSSNQLDRIPPSVIHLQRLTKLKLQNNRLQRLTPEIIKLTKLASLDISDNQIKMIAPNICFLKKLETVRHTGNPIEFPPSHVVGKGTDVLLKFLEDRMNRSVPIRRVRLLLVGQENVGKSSISHYLKTDLPNQVNISTDGIQIDDWEVRINTGNVVQPVEIKIWDFAGQEVYYSTHQLFLGGQSIYIVVWNIISDERETRLRFWLESIKARTSGNASVILVATHVDHELCTAEYARDALGAIEKKYCSRFSFIRSIIGVSCSTGEGFAQLRDIIKTAVSEQKHIGKFIPSKYLFLEKEMLSQSKERVPPLISFEQFKEIASLFDIHNEAIHEACDLLHQWGSVIHHNDVQLKDMVIIDPAWLVQVMATILTTKHRYIKSGLLKHADLVHIWHETEYPRDFHPALLQLLQKFEVTYNLNNVKNNTQKWEDGVSLVPSVLPEAPNPSAKELFPEFEDTIQYAREYKFNFIPAGFINHLLIRVIHQTLECYYWRFGIAGFFRDDPSSKVLLELLPQHSLLKVTVRGSAPVKYFLRIVDIIEAFIESWFHLDVSVQVPCTHCFYDQIQPSHRFTYETCKEAAVLGESYLPCPSGSSVRLDVLVPDLSMAEVPRIEYSDIQIDKEIGKGGFATVYKASYSNRTVALKQIDLGEGSNLEDAYSDFMRESWIMSGIQHPNIIGFLGLCSNPLCIVTDFAAKGNLFDFLHSEDTQKQQAAQSIALKCKIAFDIARGMNFLHDRIPAIIHADLKSPNILLFSLDAKESVVAVVADFGLSRTWVPVLQGRQVDNPVWLAPEILCGKGYSESADVYAFGVILYEIFTLKEFFGEFTFMSALEDALMEGKRPPLPDSIHSSFRKLIEVCWHQEPTKRPSFEEILKTLKALIQKHVPVDEINIKGESGEQSGAVDYASQCLVHSFSLASPLSCVVPVNGYDDLWCFEKGSLSVWNIYDAYVPEKQIPLFSTIHTAQYSPVHTDPIGGDSSGVVWTADTSHNIQLWDSESVRLLYSQKYSLGDIHAFCCLTNQEMWVSTSTGTIMTFNAHSLQTVLSHLNGSSCGTNSRISSSLRPIFDKLGNPKQGIHLQHIQRDHVTMYNSFKGIELRQWLQKNVEEDSLSSIISELLSRSLVIPAIKSKHKNKKVSKKLRDNALYVLSCDFSAGIELAILQGSPVGFYLAMKGFERAEVYCMEYDVSGQCVWLGTQRGFVIFDLFRCGISASVACGAVKHLVVAGDNIWVAEEGSGVLQVYNKYSLSLVRKVKAHHEDVSALVYCETSVWSGSSDSSIKVWSSCHYHLLETFADFHTSEVTLLLCSSKEDSHVLSCGKDGTAGVWKYCSDTNWEFSEGFIEKTKFKYFGGEEESKLVNVNILDAIEKLQQEDCNYISLELDAQGYLDLVDSNVLSVEQLYDQLTHGKPCYVLYSYVPPASAEARLIFYLYNPDEAPQSHQTLYYELFESVISVIEATGTIRVHLSFVVEHGSQLAESYLLYQLESIK